MKRILLALLILGCRLLAAQTAKVIELSPADAVQAKTLHLAAVEASKREADFHAALRKKYLRAPLGDKSVVSILDGKETYSIREGWGGGEFEFSEDFRFIVPITFHPAPSTLTGCQNWIPATTNLTATQ